VDLSTPALRRAFMQQTLESLAVIKDTSDAALTKIIESNKHESQMILKGSEPNKRVKVSSNVEGETANNVD
jgi:hypothetical protein